MRYEKKYIQNEWNTKKSRLVFLCQSVLCRHHQDMRIGEPLLHLNSTEIDWKDKHENNNDGMKTLPASSLHVSCNFSWFFSRIISSLLYLFTNCLSLIRGLQINRIMKKNVYRFYSSRFRFSLFNKRKERDSICMRFCSQFWYFCWSLTWTLVCLIPQQIEW